MAFGLAACAPSEPPAEARIAAAKPEGCGALATSRFEQDGLPARDYAVYAPCGLRKKERPALVVYLHGCTQTARNAAEQTRWNDLADAHGFVVAYPEQFDPNSEPFGPGQLEHHLFDGNGARCWNWFRPEHITRGAGEAATLAGITQRVMADHRVDPARVWVMGISAGGAMAGVMAATYPDLFSAAAIVAGVPYPAASDPSGALAWHAMGERARRMPVMVAHGTADPLVAFPLGVATVQQWLGANDLADDGAVGSVPRTAASIEHHGVDESMLANVGTPGDICVGNRRGFPCPGGVLGFEDHYPYSVEHYVDAAGAPLIDFWIIHGLMHNYPGGDPAVPFSDPLGPGITQAAFDFFSAQAGRAP